jgi:hypothetical protein
MDAGGTLRVSRYSELRLNPKWVRSALNHLDACIGPVAKGLLMMVKKSFCAFVSLL